MGILPGEKSWTRLTQGECGPKGQQEGGPVQILPTAVLLQWLVVCEWKSKGYKRESWQQEKHSFLACQSRKMFRLAVLVSHQTQTQSKRFIFPSIIQSIFKSHSTFLSLSSAARPLLLLRLRPRPTPTTATAMAWVATLDTATLA